MGKVTNALCVLGAAVATAMAPLPAQAQTLRGEGLQFFITLTEQFALAQVGYSAEFRKDRTEQNFGRMFRELYLGQVVQHEAKQTEIDALSDKIEREGLPNLSACHDVSMQLNAFVDRENLLRDYDEKVRQGKNPGPALRSRDQLIRTSQIFTRNSQLIHNTCTRLANQ